MGDMNGALKIMKQLVQEPTGFDSAYDAGFDCGKNGSDTTNCNFKWFRTPESTKEWERGKADGEDDG